ncbi:MAG: hypothetical protein PHQ86_04990 [Dehalococcoidales bacterium]|nr:hypothetical protein [Dehalococcoidales bacterium]
MSKLTRLLACTIPIMLTILILVQVSGEPKFLTEHRYYRIILAAWSVSRWNDY